VSIHPVLANTDDFDLRPVRVRINTASTAIWVPFAAVSELLR